MIVHGFEVTPEIEAACLAAMMNGFKNFEIYMLVQYHPDFIRHNMAAFVAYRAVDRLIQRERKAGRIKRVGGRWERVRKRYETLSTI